MTNPKVFCKWCDRPTTITGTGECTPCRELRQLIQTTDPAVLEVILLEASPEYKKLIDILNELLEASSKLHDDIRNLNKEIKS